MKRVQIRVIGKVQGVFFRASTKNEAEILGVKGFVKNEDDGSVFIEAEGANESVDSLIAWSKSGPILANVQAIDVKEFQSVMEYQTFEIIK